MLELLRYWQLKFRYPTHGDFLAMGYGIAARERRARRFWRGHLRNCWALQQKALPLLAQRKAASSSAESPNGGATVISVLGAGRLFDLDRAVLEGSATALHLFDADPGCLRVWQRVAGRQPGAKIIPHLVDLTATLDRWQKDLRRFLVSTTRHSPDFVRDFAAFLRRLTVPHGSTLAKSLALPHADLVISLNLLSQIPIYWRDRVHSLVQQLHGLDTDDEGQYPDELQRALEHSMAALQQQHRELLVHSGAALVLLISDRSFFYYRRDVSPWQEHPALFGLAARSLKQLPGYRLREQESWLWHLAPQGIEQPGHGEIHEVWGGLFEIAPS